MPHRPPSQQEVASLRSRVELVRRILYAFGGDGTIAVTKQKPNLFDSTMRPQKPHPGLVGLFVQALANS